MAEKPIPNDFIIPNMIEKNRALPEVGIGLYPSYPPQKIPFYRHWWLNHQFREVKNYPNLYNPLRVISYINEGSFSFMFYIVLPTVDGWETLMRYL